MLFEAGKVHTGLVNPKSVDWASTLSEDSGTFFLILFTKGSSNHFGGVLATRNKLCDLGRKIKIEWWCHGCYDLVTPVPEHHATKAYKGHRLKVSENIWEF